MLATDLGEVDFLHGLSWHFAELEALVECWVPDLLPCDISVFEGVLEFQSLRVKRPLDLGHAVACRE